MTKKIQYAVTGLLLLFLFIILYSGCSKDTITGTTGTPPFFGGYADNEAGITMTLASLSYTAENNPDVSQIKDSLILQLADTTYYTRGNWKLAWGPGITLSRSNMMYVAVDSTQDTIYYAIAIRGTDWAFPVNIQEDMEVWKLREFMYGLPGDSVAAGSLDGLDSLILHTKDPVSMQSLETFLTSVQGNHLKMFITGHSLGGALATLMTSWFINRGFAGKFALETYTFAAPTVGTPVYADHYNSIVLGVNAQSHMVVNTKDLVPFGWAGLNRIIPEQIPTFVPIDIGVLIIGVGLHLDSLGIKYQQVQTYKSIGTMPPPTGCSSGTETENYFCWVGYEHSHNNYLRLLGADTVRVTKKIKR